MDYCMPDLSAEPSGLNIRKQEDEIQYFVPEFKQYSKVVPTPQVMEKAKTGWVIALTILAFSALFLIIVFRFVTDMTVLLDFIFQLIMAGLLFAIVLVLVINIIKSMNFKGYVVEIKPTA